MTLVLQISDPHFGTEQLAVARALTQLVRDQTPGVLVLSGDITQRARAAQFEAARRFVDALAIPLRLTLPGNHDIPLFNPYARLFTPYANYLKAFGPDLQPVLETASLLAISVNTTRWWRHKNGEVSPAQIEQVAERLRTASPSQLRLIVIHQPVHVLRQEDVHDRLRGHDAAMRAWAAAGADIIMGGHIHLPYVCALHDDVAGLARRIWCVQAGTALSSRVRKEAPNSVNLLRFWADRQPLCCHAEQWDFHAASGRFEMVQRSELMLDRSECAQFSVGAAVASDPNEAC